MPSSAETTSRQLREQGSTFYPRWVAANAWAEAAGLGTTLLLGRAVAPVLEQDAGWGAVLLGAAAAVILGILLEGVVVGWAQARVLRLFLPGLPAGKWIKGTMLGAGVAWVVGMVPSTVAALVTAAPSTVAAPAPEPPAPVQYGLALLLGAVTGPVLGVGQWLVLRRHVVRAGRWIVANAVAWALGMVVIFLGMDHLPWGRGGLVVPIGIYGVCGTAGALVGAIHGRVLRNLLRDRVES
jgi:hypothetical protein